MDDTLKLKVYKKPTFIGALFKISQIYIVLIICIALFSYIKFIKFTDVSKVKISAYEGKHIEAVKTAFRQFNLKINIIEQYSDSVEKNYVISQWPKKDSLVKNIDSREITLYVSKGSEFIRMPDIQKIPYEKALDLLNKIQDSSKNTLKLHTTTRRIYSEDIAEGIVITQSPLPGDKVLSSTIIEIIVSNGKDNVYIEMPDFTDMQISEAEEELKTLNLSFEKLELYHKNKVYGVVLNQEPQAGSKIKEFGTVKIFWNARKPALDKVRPIIFPYITPYYEGMKRIKIVLEDAYGESIIHNKLEPPSKQIFVKFSINGTGKIKIYIDDRIDKIKNID